MRPVHDIRWLAEPPKPGRQYAFGRRGDRRRIAQRLAAGWDVGQVALAERAPEVALRELLRDDGFERLVAHYRELLARDPDERARHLAELAFAILTTALEAGDVRVALFVMHERLRGRRPDDTVARALARSLEAAATPLPEPPAAEPPARPATAPARPPARSPAAPPRREADFPYCAATQPSPEAAEALAVAEASRLGAGLQATVARLRQQLLGETERAGTVSATPGTPAELELATQAATFARAAHFRGSHAIAAAARLQAQREAARAGTPYPRPPAPAPSPVAQQWERDGVRASEALHTVATTSAQYRPHPIPLPSSTGEGARAAVSTPEPPPRYPDWLATLPRDHMAHAVRLPDHELVPYLKRVAAMYSVPWDPPDSG
jgi:hypothetical protein